MFPWLWIWMPRFELPLSGDVAQKISPDWFFNGIQPVAGDGEIEQKAFNIASYGRQLGLLTEVLLHLAKSDKVDEKQFKSALEQLNHIYEQIEEAKQSSNSAESLLPKLERMRQQEPEEFKRLLAHFAH
ncbi:hypothetical protein [Pleionea sp. CnH1-48]|uniref:hypothetical protein n=1 Tax=Pleionea sp. CnH1-48 TaxID=2954494 RepID=UPI002096870B|nr:hypothetical protein [Pleionea sp. CnH1-48]MCO7224569.1 hypothetical protein [Pleionea sp. CnH1-48]